MRLQAYHLLGHSDFEGNDLLALLQPANRDVTTLADYVIEHSFGDGQESRLFLLPTVADSKLLDKTIWDTATERFISDELLPSFRKTYKLDYLLIDCRSGLSGFANYAVSIAHLEVLVCRLDSQNKYGLHRITTVCRASGKPFRIVASGCPSQGFRKHLSQFEAAVGTKVDFVIPYEPSLYFRESLLCAITRAIALRLLIHRSATVFWRRNETRARGFL